MDRITIGANGRAGIEMVDGASFLCDNGWIGGTSNTAGPGYGLQMGNKCTFTGSGVALVGNEIADIAIPSDTSDANVILRNSYQLLPTLGTAQRLTARRYGTAPGLILDHRFPPSVRLLGLSVHLRDRR